LCAEARLRRQALELRRAARQAGPHAGDKRLDAIGDLRDPILDGPLGGGEPATAILGWALAEFATTLLRRCIDEVVAYALGTLRARAAIPQAVYRQRQLCVW